MSVDSQDSERKSALVNGKYFSEPLPVYSSDSSYETDDETDGVPSSSARVAARRTTNRTSMDSILSLGYEYETDSEDESGSAPNTPSHPAIKREASGSSETKKKPQDQMGLDSQHSLDSIDEYETDPEEDATEPKRQAQTSIVSFAEDSSINQGPGANDDANKPPPTSTFGWWHLPNEKYHNHGTGNQTSGSSETKKKSQDQLGFESLHSLASVEYETDPEDASAEPINKQQSQAMVVSFEDSSSKRTPQDPDADDAAKPQPTSDFGWWHLPNEKYHNHGTGNQTSGSSETKKKSQDQLGFGSMHSLASVEYETDPEQDESSEPNQQQSQAMVVSFEDSSSNKRTPQDPDADDTAKPPPTSESSSNSPIRHLTKENIEKWKASSPTVSQELQKKSGSHDTTTPQEDLLLRLRQLESDKVSSENQVAELLQLLEQERAEHEQTKNQVNNKNFPIGSHTKESWLSKVRDSIVHNALVSSTEDSTETVTALEQEIREAREVITRLDQERINLDTLSRSTIQEKDAQIEALQIKNQELLLQSQNALKERDESSTTNKTDAQRMEALQTRIQELLQSENTLKQKNESLNVLLAKKDSLLLRKDEEIASLREVIRNKDITLKSHVAASLKRMKELQHQQQGVKKQQEEETSTTTTDAGEEEGVSSSMIVLASAAAALAPPSSEVESSDDSNDQVSESIQSMLSSTTNDVHMKKPVVMDDPLLETETPTTTTQKKQFPLEYDLDEELDSLHIKVHEMMTETVSLTDLVDQKDLALRDANQKLEMVRAENTKFKEALLLSSSGAATTSSMDTTTTTDDRDKLVGVTKEESLSLLQVQLKNAQQSLSANQHIIASLEADLEIEKLRREELERMVKDINNNDSSSSVSISDVDDESLEPATTNNVDNEDPSSSAGDVAGANTGKKKKRKSSHHSSFSKQHAEKEISKLTHFIRKCDEENSKLTNFLRQRDEKISKLTHFLRQRDEGMDILRNKIQEQESLISLLNKTLSGKDAKMDRLERLLYQHHHHPNDGQTTTTTATTNRNHNHRKKNADHQHHHHSISKILEENEMTMDSLVLYRFNTEQELVTLRRQIDDLKNQVRASKETEYQLRRRTEDLSTAESQIRRFKAEVSSEMQDRKQKQDEHLAQVGQLTNDKMRLEYLVTRQLQEFQDTLRDKDDFIQKIHAEATEKGLLMDSLEISFQETKTRLLEVESHATHQRNQISILTNTLEKRNQELLSKTREQQDRDELIHLLNESRLEGQRIIAELTQQLQNNNAPPKETSRQKRLRRHYAQKESQNESTIMIAGLNEYMEPFELDLHQAEIQYNKARKNLRLAQARERLVRPSEEQHQARG